MTLTYDIPDRTLQSLVFVAVGNALRDLGIPVIATEHPDGSGFTFTVPGTLTFTPDPVENP